MQCMAALCILSRPDSCAAIQWSVGYLPPPVHMCPGFHRFVLVIGELNIHGSLKTLKCD